MGVTKVNSTMPGAVTPICNDCGVLLCWDVSEEDYAERKAFWDEWRCAECKKHTSQFIKEQNQKYGKYLR